MPVNVGDLVGFYRRKTPGMGIILEKIEENREKIKAFIELMNELGLDEVVRTGVAALHRGQKVL